MNHLVQYNVENHIEDAHVILVNVLDQFLIDQYVLQQLLSIFFFNVDNNDHGCVILATRIRTVFSNVSGLIANLSKGDEHVTSPSRIHTPNLGVSSRSSSLISI